MLSGRMYRVVKPVDIRPLQDVASELEFEDSGGVCAWVTKRDSSAPPEFHDLIKSLNLGGTPQRQFCRKLMPFQGIPVHTDEWMEPDIRARWSRFQIPIVSHPDIVMRWPEDGVSVHLSPGFIYEVEFLRPHEVINDTPYERIHIQIDQLDATV